MAKLISQGECSLCLTKLDKPKMTRHLDSCLYNKARKNEAESYRIIVEGRYAPEYWMHLLARGDAALEDLDALLRETWLECCGHLSEFQIDSIGYMSYPDSFNDAEGMGILLNEVLHKGTKFRHEYDFGSTTELNLRVVKLDRLDADTPVKILARNLPLSWTCRECDAPAELICPMCIWETDEAILCKICYGKHDCQGDGPDDDEEMALLVVNSPRMGVCGYTG